MDALLERLGAGGGRVFSVEAALQGEGGGGASGGRLLEHLGWPCTLRTALLVGSATCSNSHTLSHLATPQAGGHLLMSTWAAPCNTALLVTVAHHLLGHLLGRCRSECRCPSITLCKREFEACSEEHPPRWNPNIWS